MMNNNIIITIGTIIRHKHLDEFWTITDCYFNLLNEECEFMAKSDDKSRGELYIPQEVMLKNIKSGIYIIESVGEEK